MIEIADSEEKLRLCYRVMVQLRPDYDEETFLNHVQLQQQAGYQLAFVMDKGHVVAVAGFRLSQNLAWGRFLYVDDLITDNEHRSQGYGRQLLEWLMAFARQNGCKQLHLDSGLQRKEAHRFYERQGMSNASHHYSIQL